MADQAENTDTTKTPTPAERLAATEAENADLRERLETVGRMDEDRKTRDERLREQEGINAKLREQVVESGVREALRAAAADLNIPTGVAEMYRHRLTGTIGADGALDIKPSPYEMLAKAAKTDPLVTRPAKEAAPAQGGSVSWDALLANPLLVDNLTDENAVRLARHMGLNPERDGDLIGRASQIGGNAKGAWMRLKLQARRAGYSAHTQ